MSILLGIVASSFIEQALPSARFWRVFTTDSHSPSETTVGVTELELRDIIGGPDLTSPGEAATRAITNSQYSSNFGAHNAFDDVIAAGSGNIWATANNQHLNAWVGWDFGAGNEKTIVEVVVTGFNNTLQSPKDIRVDYSHDGVIWYTAWDEGAMTWTALESKTFQHPNAPIPEVSGHRHWRLFFSRSTINDSYLGVGEVELRGVAGGPDLTIAADAGTKASASSYVFPPSNAFNDNEGGTDWLSAAGQGDENGWLAWDFGVGNEQDINEVTMHPPSNLQSAPKDVLIQYSDDGGVTWADSWDEGAQTWDGSTKTFTKP